MLFRSAPASGLPAGASPTPDTFSGYSYGGVAQAANGGALYATPPTLSLNTNVPAGGMAQQQLSPAVYTPQSHQPHLAPPGSANPYSGFGGGYGVLGMGLPAVGFPYNGQMTVNFAQVSVRVGPSLVAAPSSLCARSLSLPFLRSHVALSSPGAALQCWSQVFITFPPSFFVQGLRATPIPNLRRVRSVAPLRLEQILPLPSLVALDVHGMVYPAHSPGRVI